MAHSDQTDNQQPTQHNDGEMIPRQPARPGGPATR